MSLPSLVLLRLLKLPRGTGSMIARASKPSKSISTDFLAFFSSFFAASSGAAPASGPAVRRASHLPNSPSAPHSPLTVSPSTVPVRLTRASPSCTETVSLRVSLSYLPDASGAVPIGVAIEPVTEPSAWRRSVIVNAIRPAPA